MGDATIVWTQYMKYLLSLLGYDPAKVENLLRHSAECYMDTVTGRAVVIGRHESLLVMIPYDRDGDTLTPVTIHAITQQQIISRFRSGRLKYE